MLAKSPSPLVCALLVALDAAAGGSVVITDVSRDCQVVTVYREKGAKGNIPALSNKICDSGEVIN